MASIWDSNSLIMAVHDLADQRHGDMRRGLTCSRCSADTKSSPQDDCRLVARCSAPASPSDIVCSGCGARHMPNWAKQAGPCCCR